MRRQTLDKLNAARAEGRPVVLATALDSGDARLVEPGPDEDYEFCGADLEEEILKALSENRSSVIAAPGGEIFLNVFNPALRLVIVGAVHIAQALIPMATALGYDVTVIDPRGAFADGQRFAGLDVSLDWPDEALLGMALDARTAVVTLTHDPKLDDAALAVALKSDVFFIGCLGSRKTHDARLQRLRQAGFGKDSLARIHGPVGLDIGARSAAEIALSVLAQMTQVLNGRAP
ncbi:MAG: XdhC family protein [Proteobacteria bacterium]|nr:XdhC family protein [Pseudomonadota bacterium]